MILRGTPPRLAPSLPKSSTQNWNPRLRMTKKSKNLSRIALLFATAAMAAAQTAAPALYDPDKTFAPLTLPDPVNSCRAGNGAPGPDYWQNSADYEIHANLDP